MHSSSTASPSQSRMQVISGIQNLSGLTADCAVGLGVFDGVHLGHQALLREVVRRAQSEHLLSVAYTFHPHPASLLSPHTAPKLLESLSQRLQRLEQLGIAVALVEPFDQPFADIDAAYFANDLLGKRLRAKRVVVGAGFRFGAGRRGDVALLTACGKTSGFTVHPVEPCRHDGLVVSSTRIRHCIQSGAVDVAARLLGRSFAISGQVVTGNQRGTALGFPTANLQTTAALLPANGVYAGYAQGRFGRLPAVVNIGVAPTFGPHHGGVRIEAHCPDYRGGPLYGEPMEIAFLTRLRGERAFASLDELKAQITLDIAAATAFWTTL